MATTDQKLDEPGSLPRPGPVGRLVRPDPTLVPMAFYTGVGCLLAPSLLFLIVRMVF